MASEPESAPGTEPQASAKDARSPRSWVREHRAFAIALGAGALLIVGAVIGLGWYWTAHRAGAGSTPTATGTPDIAAYRGLGGWVDLFDSTAWNDPAFTVADMANHGVRTIYIETANSSSSSGLVHPDALAKYITEAHARKMRVVAWYLPHLRDEALDFGRVRDAIEFRTSDGQRFDSFALDIESTKVASQSARNARLVSLSEKIREVAGPHYALGAIIPAPRAIQNKAGYWETFPYAALGGIYDVFLPMHYYTFNKLTPAKTYSTTLDQVRILHSQPGCESAPVHMIGGLSEDSSTEQVSELVRGSRDAGCIGASLYEWAGTTSAQWHALAQANALPTGADSP